MEKKGVEEKLAAQFRQGDVLLVRVAAAPLSALPVRKRGKRIILADGEVTGHAHAIESDTAKLLRDGEGARFLVLSSFEKLVHEEHETIQLEPGTYRVVRQKGIQAGPVTRTQVPPGGGLK